MIFFNCCHVAMMSTNRACGALSLAAGQEPNILDSAQVTCFKTKAMQMVYSREGLLETILTTALLFPEGLRF